MVLAISSWPSGWVEVRTPGSWGFVCCHCSLCIEICRYGLHKEEQVHYYTCHGLSCGLANLLQPEFGPQLSFVNPWICRGDWYPGKYVQIYSSHVVFLINIWVCYRYEKQLITYFRFLNNFFISHLIIVLCKPYKNLYWAKPLSIKISHWQEKMSISVPSNGKSCLFSESCSFDPGLTTICKHKKQTDNFLKVSNNVVIMLLYLEGQ